MAENSSAEHESHYCMRCRGDIHPEAVACPHCGAEFTNTEAYKQKQEAEGNASCLALVIMGIVIVVAVIWVMFD